MSEEKLTPVQQAADAFYGPAPLCCNCYDDTLLVFEGGFKYAIDKLREGTEHKRDSSCMAGDCDLCPRIQAADWLEGKR